MAEVLDDALDYQASEYLSHAELEYALATPKRRSELGKPD